MHVIIVAMTIQLYNLSLHNHGLLLQSVATKRKHWKPVTFLHISLKLQHRPQA